VAEDAKGEGHTGKVTAIVNDGEKLWSTAWDDTLKCLSAGFQPSVGLGQQPRATCAHKGRVAVVTESYVIIFENGKETARASLAFDGTAVTIHDNSVVVGSSTGSLHSFNGGLKPSSVKYAALRGGATYLSTSPSGEYLAAGDASGKITLFKTADGTVVTNRWIFHTSRVSSIAWHPDGSIVAAGSADTNIIIYSVHTPSKNIRLHGAHKDGVEAVLWTSADSLASGGADACVKHWKVEFGSLK
jgi:WD40 repeat protein